MNWTIIIIETIILTAAFTAMILIPLVKNPVWWIADYPEDIQEEYFKTHERIPSKFFTPTVLLKKGMALIIALILLLVVVKLAGAHDFWSAFGVGYGMWLFIDWYDCFFLDWVLFANMKKVFSENGQNDIPINLNMEFVGNPGTAKATVARIVAGIFGEIGLLPGKEVVEVVVRK